MWPKPGRKTAASRAPAILQTGYYAGFFLAAALNFTVGASFGWRAMFLCGGIPVLVTLFTLARVREPERWKAHHAGAAIQPAGEIFSAPYLRRTIVNTALVSIAIIGLWAGSVYEPTALITLAHKAGLSAWRAPAWPRWARRFCPSAPFWDACCCRYWPNASAARRPWRFISAAWP